MSDHILRFIYEEDLHLEFHCEADETALCRKRPVDKSILCWDHNTVLDSGNHKCVYQEWVDDLVVEDAFIPGDNLPSILSTIPISIWFNSVLDSPMIIGVNNE